jgi:hypothetical protein
MAEFMYLLRGGRPEGSPEQMQKHMQRWVSWIAELSKSGNFKSGDPLEDRGRVVSGTKKTVHDGPYAEAKDLVGGYFLVTARDLDEATELAKGCPIFDILEGSGRVGSVEIRQISAMPSRK